jgi:hypothetical protein
MKEKPERNLRPILWMLLVLLAGGCGRPIEGCLDIRALNFKADADRNCCCEWPPLNLTINHRVGEENHNPVENYLNSQGQRWQLLSPVVLLSGITLHFEGQPPLPLLDSMLLTGADGQSRWWRRDQVLIERDAARLTLGRFIGHGRLDSLTCLIGLPPEMQQYPPSVFPEGHPLRSERYMLWSEGTGYAAMQARFLAPDQGQDTLLWRSGQMLPLTIPVGQEIRVGFGAEVNLTLNYRHWFLDQDLTGPSPQPDAFWPWQVRASFQ